MKPLVLQTATRYIQPLLLLYSVFLLFAGHNAPGGGFAGGLVATAAFALHAIAFDVPSARKLLRIDPHVLIGLGLCVAWVSGVFSILRGDMFLETQFADVHLPELGDVHLMTPQFFDAGVYAVVLGVSLLIIFSMAEEE
jgi:multicomponent Na+:H+ antiporter subunit B